MLAIGTLVKSATIYNLRFRHFLVLLPTYLKAGGFLLDMNFQDLKTIEGPDFFLDLAYSRAKKRSDEERSKKKKDDPLRKAKRVELMKIGVVRDTLSEKLMNILTAYPEIDKLDPFYTDLIKTTLDYPLLKKSLGAVKWCEGKISDFHKIYHKKIVKTEDVKVINRFRKEYYGRVASLLKQIKKNLEYLEETRKAMKGFPSIKTKMFTVCIAGFPNVGKSTLLSKLTSAKPEVNAYPFTTKSLNLGYMEDEYKDKIQLIDTPGTLDRFKKMNPIERHAHLAMLHLADQIVYVYDLTEEYPVESQDKLLEKTMELGKPVILFLSKTDILEELTISDFREKHPEIYTDIDALSKRLWSEKKKKRD